MKVNVIVDHTGGGRGGKLGEQCCGKEKVWTRCNKSCFMIPRIVSSNGVKVFAVRVACNEIVRGGCGCG